MPASYPTSLKSARYQQTANAIDAGIQPGYLEIGTANMSTVLVTIPLNDPCGVVVGTELVFNGFPKSAQVIVNGDAAAAVIKDGNGNIVVGSDYPLTVGTSPSSDIQIASLQLTTGNTVIVNSLRIISP